MKRKFIYFFIIIGIIALVYFRFTNRTSNQSIKYEDKNSNGIWDDVEPFIKANAKNELQKKALEFEAKAFQEIILNPENALEVKQGNYSQDILGRAFACRRIVWGRLTTRHKRYHFSVTRQSTRLYKISQKPQRCCFWPMGRQKHW